MLSMYRTSSQKALNKFLKNKDITMSQQALSKARNEFDHSPFQKIYNVFKDAEYSSEQLSSLEKHDGKFIIAIDVSSTELSNLSELREKFGVTSAKASSATARMSITYDVFNDFVVDADFSPLSVSERTHAKNHINNFGKLFDLKNTIFIMDRGYASKELITLLSEKAYLWLKLWIVDF